MVDNLYYKYVTTLTPNGSMALRLQIRFQIETSLEPTAASGQGARSQC
jgi:hypothetical protein